MHDCKAPPGGTPVPRTCSGAREPAFPLLGLGCVRGRRFATVSIILQARSDREIAVSTALRLDLGDPAWPERLVAAVSAQATAGARRLCDELLTATPHAAYGFVPLAALLPDASAR